MRYEYGAMSSKFSLEADNKLTAYATMIFHYDSSAHLMVIYEPKESKEDCWMSITGQVSERLHEVFGGAKDDYPQNDAFDKYVSEHIQEIKQCYKTIKRIT